MGKGSQIKTKRDKENQMRFGAALHRKEGIAVPIKALGNPPVTHF